LASSHTGYKTQLALSLVTLPTLWFSPMSYLILNLALITILYPKESRWVLELIAHKTLFFIQRKSTIQHSSDIITEVCAALAKNQTGAIIVIKNHDSIPETNSGIPINGELSVPLLLSIFNDYSPLHDGAVVISEDRILQARVILPLATSEELTYYGTRHRAGLGLSEVCDAKVIVISEETGSISLFHKKQFLKDLSPENLHQLLQLD
jgi:diadenylate cyclase